MTTITTTLPQTEGGWYLTDGCCGTDHRHAAAICAAWQAA